MTFSVDLTQGIKEPSQHLSMCLFYLEINYIDTILLPYFHIAVTSLLELLKKPKTLEVISKVIFADNHIKEARL